MKLHFRRNVICQSIIVHGIFFLFFSISPISLVAQQDSGFTNKVEAKNQLVNGLKEGKWVEYFRMDNSADTESYRLTLYKEDKPCGIQREYYYKSGKIKSRYPFTNGKINGVEKEYYENGKLKIERPYTQDQVNGVVNSYYESGKLESKSTIVSGTRVKFKRYDENGHKIKPKYGEYGNEIN